MPFDKPVIFSDFHEAIRNRFVKYFRFNNSDYWKEYYSKKLSKLDIVREKSYAKIVRRYVGAGGRVLDIGGGIGFFAKELDCVGLKVWMVDLFDDMIEEAKKYLHGTSVKIDKADILQLPYDKSAFDCVTLESVIEHFPEAEVKDDILPKVHQIIKPGGYLFVHVPVKSPASQFARLIRKYFLRDLPNWAIDDDGDVTHKLWISYKEYIEMITEGGFELVNYDFQTNRSNMKPYIFSVLMRKLQVVFDKSDPDLITSYNIELSSVKRLKAMKSFFSVSSYFIFKRSVL